MGPARVSSTSRRHEVRWPTASPCTQLRICGIHSARLAGQACETHVLRSLRCCAGTRDFFPEDKRLQNWLFDEFAAVSRLFGFEQVRAAVFCPLPSSSLLESHGAPLPSCASATCRGWRTPAAHAVLCEQVDFPVLESEELFVRKAGEEICDQLYNFEVRLG